MDTKNRFVKLLTVSIDKQGLLLYGFSVPTTQETLPWKKKKGKKNKWKLGICSAILSPAEAESFEQYLSGTEDITMGSSLTLIAPDLKARKPVLSYRKSWEEPAPISRLSCVHELWNTQKEALVQQVQKALGTSGKQLYLDMQGLIAQLKEECGIDFSKSGSRFGNYEFYDQPALACNLEVHCARESKGKRIVVQKPMEWDRPLIVNCIAERHERFLFNQIQALQPEDSELEFTAEETIVRYTVCAWDQITHELVFYESNALINQITLRVRFGETARIVRDPWSESLLSSAANKSDVIHEKVETVQRYSSDHPMQIGGDGDSISKAADSGDRLLSPYTMRSAQGAFIPNGQKDGEINSFLKIKEYLNSDSVCYAVLADPYFSVPSAAKLLSRISNISLELTIITSLGSIDPDTGEVRNVVEEYREFLQHNVGLLHGRLYVCNLHRGKKQVFHDRYLIRYHADGRIDGFLLSNSLNSMGQFYPFVIAPLEPDVCRSVAAYLDQLKDPDIQSKQPKKQRVACDVLFDFRKSAEPKNQPVEKSADCASKLLQRQIAECELPDVLNEIWSHWEEESEEVCRVLSRLGACTYLWTAAAFAELFCKNRFMVQGYKECFLSMARAIEKTRRNYGSKVDREEYTYWTLLTGKSKPHRTGFLRLLEDPSFINYTGENWLIGGYHLLLEMDSVCFVEFLEETCSPMMLNCLIERLCCFSWSEPLYSCLLVSKNECVKLLAIHWPVYLLKHNRLEPEEIFQLLEQLEPAIRLMQATRLLSETAFHIRCPNPKSSQVRWNAIYPQLLKCAADVLPSCTLEGRQSALYWLHDCEACSYCSLYLELAGLTGDVMIREDLLSKAIRIIQDDLLQCSYSRDVSRHIFLYLEGMEQLHGEQAEKEILGRLVDWNTLETAVEPELKSYAYKRWHDAYVRACWQLDLLKEYLIRHPQAQEVAKWLNIWEKRLTTVKL